MVESSVTWHPCFAAANLSAIEMEKLMDIQPCRTSAFPTGQAGIRPVAIFVDGRLPRAVKVSQGGLDPAIAGTEAGRFSHLGHPSEAVRITATRTCDGVSAADESGVRRRLRGREGNHLCDIADVHGTVFNKLDRIATDEPVVRFDYYNNGRLDFADIVRLFIHL